jgi:uncharacterized membrane protein YesL
MRSLQINTSMKGIDQFMERIWPFVVVGVLWLYVLYLYCH